VEVVAVPKRFSPTPAGLPVCLLVLLLLVAPSSPPGRAVTAAGNVRGIHTLADSRSSIDDQLTWARSLVGAGGHVTQPFFGLDRTTQGPTPDAEYFVEQAYARGLDPILVLQGHFADRTGCNASGFVGWLKPAPDAPDEPGASYAAEAAGYRRFVAGLPRVDGRTLYVQVGNEPNLHDIWGGAASPAEYARFFADVSAAIRSIGDPRIKILNAALAPGGSVDNLHFIAEAIGAEPRFASAFDYWASHPYPRNQPPEHNLHDGTALPGSRNTIDAYLLELAALAEHGADTAGLQVVLTETGYELGDAAYREYPAISEELRADYIRRAIEEYWPRWPEIRAVTPFELAGWHGSWKEFDWVWPSSATTEHGFPTQPRLQYARLVPGTGIVLGTALDENGFPLKDATLSSDPDGHRAVTLPDGTFVMLAYPGVYAVTAEKRGYGPATARDVVVASGQSTRLELLLPARLPAALQDGGFEAGDLSGWTRWGAVDGVQEGPWYADVAAPEGERFLGTAVNCGEKDGGVQQSVAAQPSTDVTLRAWALTRKEGTAGIRNRVGIDPSGGTDPGAAGVVWSPWVETGGRWEQVGVSTRTLAERVTIFLEHDQNVANAWNISAFDGVELVPPP
jgi:Carboxypeptidase regulatory-like domain